MRPARTSPKGLASRPKRAAWPRPRHRNSYEGLGDYAAWLIGWKVGRLIGSYGYTDSDRDDLEQDLALDLLRRLPHFDPSRAQLNTFIARVIDHCVSTIIEARTARCRDWRATRRAPKEAVTVSADSEGHRTQAVTKDGYLVRTRAASRSEETVADLGLDVRRLVAKLPPRRRRVCEALAAGIPPTEIAREIGVHRATVYEDLAEIRRAFRAAGLEVTSWGDPTLRTRPRYVSNQKHRIQPARERPSGERTSVTRQEAEREAMGEGTYSYHFDESVPISDVGETLLLAVLAAESIHGRARVQLDASFRLDETGRTCVVDAGTDVGRDIARIFTGYLTSEFGEQAFQVERLTEARTESARRAAEEGSR